MSKKLESAIELAQLHYEVVNMFGTDMETDVFPFIQENWTKGHKLFEILEKQEYELYVPYVMKNFTHKQINQFFDELAMCFEF
jgi:hypothetical protein